MLHFIKLIIFFVLLVVGFSVALPPKGNKLLQPRVSATNGRIVGGVQTTIDAYPYQVSVRLDTYTLLHICGGAVYAKKVILTAAHCIKGRFASYIYVVAGATTIVDQYDQTIRASKLIYHKGYNKNTHENDIGLIALVQDLEYSKTVQPISLADIAPVEGEHATVTGWGKNDEDAVTLTNTLHAVDVLIVDSAVCSSQYLAKNYVITEQMVCAGVDAGGRDACQGDSGGPLTVDDKLVGIVSWGLGCARSGYPGVYASVPYHKEWIIENASPYV